MSMEIRCQYILPKKKRRCRMLRKEENQFCGEHMIYDPNNSERVPCPNDPKHTILLSELDDHVKKCNSRLQDVPWIDEFVNKVNKSSSSLSFTRPSEIVLSDVIQKVNAIYNQIEQCSELPRVPGFYNDGLEEASKAVGEKKKLHLLQIDSIIHNISKESLLNNATTECLIDLGSGKARLVYWLSKYFPETRYLLVDKMGSRNKFDRKAIKENLTLQVERLRCSIENLKLSEIPILRSSDNVVAVCKHFCGAATDYGIRSLINGEKEGLKLNGFALAPCCHHKCIKEEFVGQPFLEEHGIISEEEFYALCHISSWNCCGFDTDAKSKLPSTLEPDVKEELGIKAKRILEYARAEFLRSVGFNVKLVQYVDRNVSPENLLILGKK